MSRLSIIIPAHDEEAVIARCLRQLLHLAVPGELDVVVVCNGCRDKTADVARSFGDDVRVVETEIPSKANALNLGDREAIGFPRLFVDADVVIGIEAVRAVAEALREPGVLAAAPLLKVDLTDRPWGVRAYYGVWLRLPYVRSGMIGSGVYAVNEEGRRRFGEFPDATADDAFVRLHFQPHERRTVSDCSFTVFPPKTLSRIIDIKTRSHFGNAELKQRFPHLWKNEETRHGRELLKLARNPLLWPSLAVYLYVKLATRRRAAERFRKGEIRKWERDDSSREPVGEPAGR